MLTRIPILHLLLVVLLAVSPSACPCPRGAERAGGSCCAASPERDDADCCGSGHEGRAAESPSGCCGTREKDDGSHPGGCDRCKGGCKCKTGPTMKAEARASVDLAPSAAAPMVFGLPSPVVEVSIRVRAVRIEARAVHRPVTSLLRQHCALTI